MNNSVVGADIGPKDLDAVDEERATLRSDGERSSEITAELSAIDKLGSEQELCSDAVLQHVDCSVPSIRVDRGENGNTSAGRD